METIYFVYLLTFANSKVYVGMSRTDRQGGFTNRYRAHSNAAKIGKPLPIYHAWRKYGAPAQIVLSKHLTREECAAREIAEISARKAADPAHGYNLTHGGEGLHAPKGSAMHALMREKVWSNPERNRKASLANKGKSPSPQCLTAAIAARGDDWRAKMQEKVWGNAESQAEASERTRLQMANGGAENIARIRRLQGDRRTPEQVAAQTAKVKVFMNTPEGKEIAKRGYAAMIANPETLAKQKEGQDAWRASEKNKANCAAMAKKSAEACSKKVQDKETGAVYASQRAMARALGVSEAAISLRVKAGKIIRL
jgi:hypothetical protein